jgi:hypothetical protein
MQTEIDVQNLCRMRAQQLGAVLWRNNVGAMKDARGIPVRFGLANDSARLNEQLKSSDLIGMVPPHGRLLSVECKEPGWVWRATDHEIAQLNWLHEVRRYGGLSGFASHPDHVNDILAGGWGAHGI